MRILGLTDLNSVGSGYASLSLPIFDRLAKRGYEVKVIGLANNGNQHNFPFSIFPCQNAKEAEAILHNLNTIWPYDVLLTLMDIPFHKGLLNRLQNKPFKYVGVFPVEADPLSFGWAMVLMQMDKAFCISDFGTKECHKKGITNTEYLPVGIDLEAWQLPTEEAKVKIRAAFGLGENTFTVLTVADNQERKNLPACFKAFSIFAKDHPNSKYLLVTREHLFAGWDIQELASRFGISDKLMVFERGLPFKDLWMLYAVANAFLLLSKAEGRGIPVAEAMAMKVPIVGTDCTGIRDQLEDARGLLVPVEYMHIDPFGLGNRYWASAEIAAMHLSNIYNGGDVVNSLVNNAYKSVQGLDWEKSVDVLDNYLKGIKDE